MGVPVRPGIGAGSLTCEPGCDGPPGSQAVFGSNLFFLITEGFFFLLQLWHSFDGYSSLNDSCLSTG